MALEALRTIQADAFADRLRSHALDLPVVYFAEWADLWSMGDLFSRLLTPPGGPAPLTIHADRFEIYGYGLPDGGRLVRHLASLGSQQFVEYDWFVWQLREAVRSWEELVDQGVIVALIVHIIGFRQKVKRQPFSRSPEKTASVQPGAGNI